MAKQQQTLVSPDKKREWTPEDAEQATNLLARGWKPKTQVAAESKSPANKTDSK